MEGQRGLRSWTALGLAGSLAACGGGPTGSTSGVDSTPVYGPAAIAADGVTFIAGDGRTFSCSVEISAWVLPVGGTVPLEVDNAMNFAAQTRGAFPTIFLNLASLDRTPVAAQIFIFAHECGHVNSEDFLSEVAANCWAARRLSTSSVLSEPEWEIVHQVLLTAYPAPTGPYPSGADQWARLQTCR